MKNRLFTISILSSILLLGSTGNPNLIAEKLNNYLIGHRQEKVFVHTDRLQYGIGETIWFKAYLVDAIFHQSKTLSSVVYVELLDKEGRVVQEKCIKIVDGGGAGQFKLTYNLSSGNYLIRGYTSWMRNFDSNYFFSQPIQLIDGISDEEIQLKSNLISLNFFPEGGELVDGITSKVAFKATNEKGLGVNVSGKIYDSKNDIVTNFKTGTFGMGVTLLTPKAGLNYFAILDSDESRHDLPLVKTDGCTIKVLHSNTSSQVTVIVGSKNMNIKGGTLLIHQRGIIRSVSINDKEDSFVLNFDKSILTPGIAHLTFFDSEDRPLTERLVFLNLPTYSEDLVLKTNKDIYSKRDLVQLTLLYKNPEKGVLNGSFSMSVTPSAQINFDNHGDNVVNYFLLKSELKGIIENPNYYFSNSKETYAALDVLMLTQGWRRFNWKAVLEETKMNSVFPAEKGLVINGRLIDYFDPTKDRQGIVSMTTTNNGINVIDVSTDQYGHFAFYDNDFIDSTEVILQAVGVNLKKNKPDPNVNIVLEDRSTPPYDPNWIGINHSSLEFNELRFKQIKIQEAFNFDPEAKILDEFVFTGQRIANKDPFYVAKSLYGFPSKRIIVDSIGWIASARSAFDILRTVSGVQVGGSPPNESVMIRGSANFSGAVQPLFLIDGIQTDLSLVNSISIKDIHYIDVLKGSEAAFYGARGAGGVIALYTKRGINSSPIKSKGILSFTNPGYSRIREFYAPNYDGQLPEHVRPDFRSTIFWNPNLKLDNAGAFSANFYTSDQIGELEIRLQGVTSDGHPIFKSHFIQIE